MSALSARLAHPLVHAPHDCPTMSERVHLPVVEGLADPAVGCFAPGDAVLSVRRWKMFTVNGEWFGACRLGVGSPYGPADSVVLVAMPTADAGEGPE